MKRFKVGIIGTGYIGKAHIEALMRAGIEVWAIADYNKEECLRIAEKYGIRNVYKDYKNLIDDPEIEVIHNCTPNNMHYEINKYAIQNKKQVVCEKPLAVNSAESLELVELAKQNNIMTCVCFNYRYYPVVQHAKEMAAKKEIGNINIIQGYYLQDWLFYDTDYNWRLEPEIGGASRAIADIGSHWCDLAQFVSGLKIVEVCADLKTVHPVRKKPKSQSNTFEKADCEEYEPKPMATEDYGAILVRFEGDARGTFSVSQVSAGRKCKIRLEIYGSEKSITWDHEKANELWIGYRDQANQILFKDPALLNSLGQKAAHYPGGHPEGYPSTILNLFIDFYTHLDSMTTGNQLYAHYPKFEDGHLQMLICEAILKSNEKRQWTCL